MSVRPLTMSAEKEATCRRIAADSVGGNCDVGPEPLLSVLAELDAERRERDYMAAERGALVAACEAATALVGFSLEEIVDVAAQETCHCILDGTLRADAFAQRQDNRPVFVRVLARLSSRS